MVDWGAGAAKAWNRSTLPEHENDTVDSSHLVVQMAILSKATIKKQDKRPQRSFVCMCDHSLSNIHLVDDGRVLDWCAKRAATDAADAVRHDNAADMICFSAIDLTRHLILCRIDLLGGEDVVFVLAVVAAI